MKWTGKSNPRPIFPKERSGWKLSFVQFSGAPFAPLRMTSDPRATPAVKANRLCGAVETGSTVASAVLGALWLAFVSCEPGLVSSATQGAIDAQARKRVMVAAIANLMSRASLIKCRDESLVC
jgi:hypothetical protein